MKITFLLCAFVFVSADSNQTAMLERGHYPSSSFHHAATDTTRIALSAQPSSINRELQEVSEGNFWLFRPSKPSHVVQKDLTGTYSKSALTFNTNQESTTFIVTNTNDDGNGSLRQAILDANANPGRDTIEFNIPGPAPHTIQPISSLPEITDPVIINGYSQPGSTNVPIIELDGSGAGTDVNGLFIKAGNSTVRGLVINRFEGEGIVLEVNGANLIEGNFIGLDITGTMDFGNGADGIRMISSPQNIIGGTEDGERNVISGNDGSGIAVYFSSASGNVIQGNYIGTDVTGTVALGNKQAGVAVVEAPRNSIGGTTNGARNVIAGNEQSGIIIRDSMASENTVQGNLIGTDVTGTGALGNAQAGIAILDAPLNTIGGTAIGAGNVISGNEGSGIHIQDAQASENMIQGNFIGTDVTGAFRLGNKLAGVAVLGAPHNVIGGTESGTRNVISGNDLAGIQIQHNAASENRIQGNFIGTDSTGSSDLGNTRSGITIFDAISNTIGGTDDRARNVVSGNGISGIIIQTNSSDNVVQGNFIGTDVTGTVALGNAQAGVLIAISSNNTIGGVEDGARNVISGNNHAGVQLQFNPASENKIQGNFIGTDVTGTIDVGNRQFGVVILSVPGNTIGGTEDRARNLISGNELSGLLIQDNLAYENTVQGNFIGSDVTGALDLGNTRDGVIIVNAPRNIIGGMDHGAGNVISGNDHAGIQIRSPAATENKIQGNFIGTDVTGLFALGNTLAGVLIDFAPLNIVGGIEAEARNLVSGNKRFGVHILNTEASENKIQGNFIGTDVTGIVDLGNALAGVYIENARYNIVGGLIGITPGGSCSGTCNVIRGNGFSGVAVVGDFSVGNTIRANAIYDNDALGIDLGLDGVTPNDLGDGTDNIDADTGPNNLMNFPVGIKAIPSPTNPDNLIFSSILHTSDPYSAKVDIYAVEKVDDSGFGEGQIYLGEITPTDALGTFRAEIPRDLIPFPFLTATATDSGGSTSEFSPVGVVLNHAIPGICYASTGPLEGGRLLTIDSGTGAGTLVGSTGLIESIGGLAINSSGEMFGTASDKLYRLDTSTGKVSFVANLEQSFEAIAFDANDKLLGIASDENLYTVNTENGQLNLVGATGDKIQGMAYDPTDGTLWASTGENSYIPDAIYTINPTTGAATLVGTTGLNEDLGNVIPDIYFDNGGNLFGVKGGEQADNFLIAIDKLTGAGTVVGRIGFSSVSGLSLRPEAFEGRHIRVLPLSIDFGKVSIGNTSSFQTVAISNIGTEDLTVTGITDPGVPFFLSTLPTLPVVIPPGAIESFAVTFSPTSPQEENATTRIISNESEDPVVVITLFGQAFISQFTPAGSNVEVSLGDDVTIWFENVNSEGVTTLSVTQTGPQPPRGFQIPFDPPTYYDIHTTARFTGTITVQINYDETQLGGAPESTLRLLHQENEKLVDITTDIDIDQDLITGQTTTLSFFVIMAINEIAGDLNNDGLVNVADLVLVINFILGVETPTEQQFATADLNEDGVLSVSDLISMINIILGV